MKAIWFIFTSDWILLPAALCEAASVLPVSEGLFVLNLVNQRAVRCLNPRDESR